MKKKKKGEKEKTNQPPKSPPPRPPKKNQNQTKNPQASSVCLGFILETFFLISDFYPRFNFEYLSIGFLCSALLISKLLRSCHFLTLNEAD